MLSTIHNAVEQLLHQQGQIEIDEVDIRFEAPTKDWIASLTRPTINLFLFDVQENTEKRETNVQTVRSNGKAERRMPPRRFDLRYMVSALTTEIEDEHQLLWRVLTTLMRYQQLPQEVLPESLRSLEPPLTARIANKEEGSNFLDIWSALGTPPHPALGYIVTVPLDLDIAIQAPIVLTRTTRYRRTTRDEVTMETAIHIGGIVRSKEGQPLNGLNVKLDSSANNGSTTDDSGRYVLRVPGGPVSLSVLQHGKIQKRVKLKVPSDSYDIVLDE